MSYVPYLLAFLSTANVTEFPQAPAGKQTVEVGGDAFPDRMALQLQTTCKGNTISISLQSGRFGPSTLESLAINGKRLDKSADYAEFRDFLKTIRLPYITGTNCTDSSIAVSVAGISLNNGEPFYRVTFAVPKN